MWKGTRNRSIPGRMRSHGVSDGLGPGDGALRLGRSGSGQGRAIGPVSEAKRTPFFSARRVGFGLL